MSKFKFSLSENTRKFLEEHPMVDINGNPILEGTTPAYRNAFMCSFANLEKMLIEVAEIKREGGEADRDWF